MKIWVEFPFLPADFDVDGDDVKKSVNCKLLTLTLALTWWSGRYVRATICSDAFDLMRRRDDYNINSKITRRQRRKRERVSAVCTINNRNLIDSLGIWPRLITVQASLPTTFPACLAHPRPLPAACCLPARPWPFVPQLVRSAQPTRHTNKSSRGRGMKSAKPMDQARYTL